MKRIQRSKNSVFLLEILIDILMFTILLVVGLTFFVKAHSITKSTKLLHQAVNICQNVGTSYTTGDANALDEPSFYYDEDFNSCAKADGVYTVTLAATDTPGKATVTFYDSDGESVYSLNACKLTPNTPNGKGAANE